MGFVVKNYCIECFSKVKKYAVIIHHQRKSLCQKLCAWHYPISNRSTAFSLLLCYIDSITTVRPSYYDDRKKNWHICNGLLNVHQYSKNVMKSAQFNWFHCRCVIEIFKWFNVVSIDRPVLASLSYLRNPFMTCETWAMLFECVNFSSSDQSDNSNKRPQRTDTLVRTIQFVIEQSITRKPFRYVCACVDLLAIWIWRQLENGWWFILTVYCICSDLYAPFPIDRCQ